MRLLLSSLLLFQKAAGDFVERLALLIIMKIIGL